MSKIDIKGYETIEILRETYHSQIYRVNKNNKSFILKISKTPNSDLNTLIKREFTILSQFKHKNIASVFDYGILKDGRAYFITEYIDGKPLNKAFSGFSFDFMDATLQILDALVQFHDRGYFHGDLKPDNILYEPKQKRAVLIDFGFASSKNDWISPRGTLGYVAPEIIKGLDIDERTDLFSLGVILHEILHGIVVGTENVVHHDSGRPAKDNENIPEPINRIVSRLVAVEPVFRPTAGEVFQTLSPYSREKRRKKQPANVSLPPLPFTDTNGLIRKLNSITGMAGSMYLVTGDKGFGKTRILNELKYQYMLANIPLLHYYPSSGMHFFTSFTERAKYKPDNGANNNKFLVFEKAIRKFIKNLKTSKHPTAIMIDDLHELDGFDRSFVRYLKYSIDRSNIFIVATSQFDFEMDKLGDKKFDLRPFSLDETAALINKTLTGLDNKEFCEWINYVSSGNPLLIEEIIKHIHEAKKLYYKDNIWHLDNDYAKLKYPRKLSDVMNSKLERLDSYATTIVQLLSLSCQPLEENLIANLVDQDPHHWIMSLLKQGLVKEIRKDEKIFYTLSTNAIKNIVLGNLGKLKKQSLGRKMFAVTERMPQGNAKYAPLLADLADLLNEQNKIYKYARMAAEEKEKLSDLESALVYYKKAAASISPGLNKELIILLNKIGDIESQTGAINMALEDYKQALPVSENEEERSTIHYKIGSLYQRQGQYPESINFFKESLKSSDPKNIQYAKIQNGLCYSLIHLQQFDEAQKLLTKSLMAADVKVHSILYAETLYLTVVLDWQRNHYENGIKTIKQILDMSKRNSNPSFTAKCYNLLGSLYQQQNKYELSEKAYIKAMDLISPLIDIQTMVVILNNLALISKNQLKYDNANHYFSTALANAKKIGNNNIIASVLSNIANIYEIKGEFEKAIQTNLEAISYDSHFSVSAQNLALLYCRKGDYVNAERTLNENAHGPPNLPYNMANALILAYRNENEKAISLVKSLCTGFKGADIEIYGKIGCYLKASEIYYNTQNYSDCMNVAREGIKIVPFDSREHAVFKATIQLCEYINGEIPKMDIDPYLVPLKETGCICDWLMLKRMEAEARCKKLGTQYDASFFNELSGIEDLCKSIGALTEQMRIQKIKEMMLKNKSPSSKPEPDNTQYLDVFSEISNIIVDHMGDEFFVNKLLDVVIHATGAERGALFIIEKSKISLLGCKNIDNQTINDAKTISRSVIKESGGTCKTIMISDALKDFDYRNVKSVILNKIRSILCVPFVLSARYKGAIYLDSRFTPGLFSQENMGFVNTVARLMAATIEKSCSFKNLTDEHSILKTGIMAEWANEYLIGESKSIIEIREMIERIAQNDSTILITGETGTGKGVVARLIHKSGNRKLFRFVQVNCIGLPETLIESELFGYKKGAFTGAFCDKIGLFEEAQGGTLFLDEIANMPYATQGKLLDAVEEKRIRRLGETKERTIDTRMICATNCNIEQTLQQKLFREDLYYRLSVLNIHMPPLRERTIDIPILADHFLRKYSLELKREFRGFHKGALKAILSYAWPGNVRELQNTIERAVILAKNPYILPDDLKLKHEFSSTFNTTREKISKESIANAIKLAKGNISFAAKILGITRPTLYKYKKYHKI